MKNATTGVLILVIAVLGAACLGLLERCRDLRESLGAAEQRGRPRPRPIPLDRDLPVQPVRSSPPVPAPSPTASTTSRVVDPGSYDTHSTDLAGLEDKTLDLRGSIGTTIKFIPPPPLDTLEGLQSALDLGASQRLVIEHLWTLREVELRPHKERIAEIEARYDQALRRSLTADQQSQFDELRKPGNQIRFSSLVWMRKG